MNIQGQEKNNILLAGATGFVGQALFLKLKDEGHQITVVTRDATRAKKIMGENVPIITWNQLDELTNHEFDVAINLSGATVANRWTKSYKNKIINSRVESTKRIAEALSRSMKPNLTLLNASGTGVGAGFGDKEISESDKITGSFLADVGVVWEKAVEPHFSSSSDASASPDADSNRRAVFLRFGAILHPQAPLWSKLVKPIKMGMGGPLGSGEQWFPFVTLHDVIRAIIFLLQSNESGPFNIVAPKISRQKEFGAALAKKLNKPFRMPVPAFVLKLALGEMSTLALNGLRAIPKRLQEAGFSFDYADTEGAINYCLEEAEMYLKSGKKSG